MNGRSGNSSRYTQVNYSITTIGEMPINNPIMAQIQNRSLHNFGAATNIVKVTGNVGVLNILFDNPVYTKELYNLGLRPETAFGCAIDFLFAPSIAVRTYFAHEFRVMSSSMLKIGIQIRLGDGYLKGGTDEKYADASFKGVQQFFACAEHLVHTFAAVDQQAVLFLVSDSLQVRQQAKTEYGKLLITKVDSPGHSKHTEGSEQIRSMIYAAGEHWLFGMADYHVISNVNSFGKSGALRSRKWHSMYQMDVRTTNGLVCDGREAMEFSQLLSIPPFI